MKAQALFGIERLSALSDGVFAIVLTLLVLELKLPEVASGAPKPPLLTAIVNQLPELITWIISFIVVARIWQQQHFIFNYMKHTNIPIITINMVLLAFCSLVPFSASLMSDYHHDPFSIVVFSILLVLNGLTIALFGGYLCCKEDLFRKDSQPHLRHQTRYNALVLPMIGGFSILTGYWHHPLVGISVWLLEPLIALAAQQYAQNTQLEN